MNTKARLDKLTAALSDPCDKLEVRAHFLDGHTQDMTWDEAWALSFQHLRLRFEPLTADAELRASYLTSLWAPWNFQEAHPEEAEAAAAWSDEVNATVLERGTYFDDD